MTDYSLLEPFALTPTQREVLSLVVKHGSQREAARASGKSQSAISEAFTRIKRNASRSGYDPESDLTHRVADGQYLGGASTLYNSDGEVVLQWVKSRADLDRQVEMAREAVLEICQDVKPKPPKKQPKLSDKDLLSLYVLTDLHLGMYAHHEEGGANWDIRIAVEKVEEAMSHLIESSRPSETAVFAQLGDYMHSDGMLPVTPTSGHVLDQDTRFYKVVRAAVRVIESTIDKLLEKHKTVKFLACQGNHDPASSIWLQEMFGALYRKTAQVEVIKSPFPYYAIQHGDVMLGFTHGHRARGSKLPDLFASEFREMVGKTRQTYIHTGHRHSRDVVEYNSAIVEQHQTIAARDSHSSHGGWNSGRSMQCITYHSKRLEIARNSYTL